MNANSDITIDVLDGFVAARSNGGEIKIKIRNPRQAIIDEVSENIYIIAGDPENEKISCYSKCGKFKFDASAPIGYAIMYLVNHSDFGASAVCGGSALVDHWYDWHFSIGSDGKLNRKCPAY